MPSNRTVRALIGLALCSTALVARPGWAAPAASAAVPEIEFTQRTLKNGLKVIAIRDTSTPNVMTSLWYEVGSKHDPHGRSGFAHLFEHILSRKTVNMPYNEINRMVDNVGGTRNASTWYDRTNYYEIVPAEYLERMLWTHAERMARPVVDKEVFETERGIVKEELRQRVLAPPYGRLFAFALGENVYNTLPHRRPTIGSIEDLDSATLEDARAFHEAYYGPDTATLIVSGNFDPAKLTAMVDRYFGPIKPRPRRTSIAITVKDKPVTARTVVASAPNVPLPAVAVAYQIPGGSHGDLSAIAVLNSILARGNHNRLDTALVKSGLATEVGSDFNETEEEGYLALYAFAAGGERADAVAGELTAAVDRLRQSGPTADELSEAKNELLAGALEERETFSGRAFELGEALVRTGDPKAADKRLAGISAVTVADVQRVTQTYLNPARRLDFTYTQGSGDPKQWANPVPLPVFRSVPLAAGPENLLRPETERDPPPPPGDKAAVAQPQFSDVTLGNGVRVIAARTGEVPLSTMTVLIGAGSATDPRAKAGRASLAAAIADKGTPTRTAEQIAIGLESLGATIGSAVVSDGTYVSVTAPTANLRSAAVILADIVRNASFPDADFARERKRAEDGLSISLKDPGDLAAMLVAPVVYGPAPYGTVSGGTPASLAGLTRDDLLGYRQQYWRPQLTRVVVSGGIDPAEARQVAEAAFGDWTVAGAAPPLPESLAGDALPGRTLVVDLPGSGQAAVYAVVRGLTRSDPSYYDALIANSVLGGSSTGRLYTEVRSKRALSYGAYSALAAQLGEGTLAASAQTKNESAADVAKIFLDEFAKIASDTLDATTVANRKTLLNGAFQRQIQTSAGFNGVLAGALLRGLEPAEAVAYADRINGTSGPGATAAIAKLLKPERVNIVIVGDSAKFIDKLRALRPNVEVVAADKLDLSTAASAK